MRPTSVPGRQWIFLSHSGLDGQRAIEIATELKRALSQRGHEVEVFNTSEPEHRFRELRELLAAGDNWAARAEQYNEQLRAYLDEHLRQSAAVIALVTRNSLDAASEFIEYEMEIAHSVAIDLRREAAIGNQRLFFFPCVADGAEPRDLPERAVEFQGISLQEEDAMAQLTAALDRALLSAAETGAMKFQK